ncbi:hypothetical protein [Roseibium sp. RKSG952]|uniref:hypothetical protein n=1 Tax=Roseibium sp. RKSG952 TaxID=2529384 RepID=UPI0012BD0807|nr:hypothetical protein [Roseibium sp. RKSG952]MTH94630.1 hypothetical protein [Roseibium sp. RKSG952]
MDLEESRAKIQTIFGRTAWIDKCLTLFDHVTSPKQDPGRKYGYNDIASITNNDEMSDELFGMTNALVSSKILDCAALFVDEEGKEFEITGAPLLLLWHENKLTHPKTRKDVPDPQNKAHLFFRVKPEIAEAVADSAPMP